MLIKTHIFLNQFRQPSALLVCKNIFSVNISRLNDSYIDEKLLSQQIKQKKKYVNECYQRLCKKLSKISEQKYTFCFIVSHLFNKKQKQKRREFDKQL